MKNNIDKLLEDVIKVLESVSNEDPYHHDHHGYCQTHGWFSKEECYVKTSKRILPLFKQYIDDQDYIMIKFLEIESQSVCGIIAKNFDESVQMLNNITEKCDLILKYERE